MSDWTPMALGDCFDLVKTKRTPASLPGGYPYVGMEHIDSDDPRLRRFSSCGEVASVVGQFSPGDVLFGRLRAYLRKVALADFDGACSTEILVMRARPNTMPRFLHLLVSSQACIDHAVATSAGSRMPRTSVKDLSSYPVALPSPPEQARIVDLMASMDADIETRQQELDELSTLLSVLRRELGSADPKVALRDLAAESGIQIGPFGSQLHAHEYVNHADGIPVVMPQDLVNGEIVTDKIKRVPHEVAQRLSRHRMAPGDIVFPRRGDLTKRALVTVEQDGWICGTGCLRFRPKNLSEATRISEALAGEITSAWLVEHAVGTTMLNLNTTILSNLPVADIADQSELADACVSALRLHRNTLTELSTLRQFRSLVLGALLLRHVEIPESYDVLLSQEYS